MPVQRSKYTLDEILQACTDFQDTYGFVNFAEIGRRLGLSRQAIQLRLRAAREKGQLDDITFGRLRPPVRSDRIDLHMRVAPETHEFITTMAEQLDVHHATLIDAAVALYRERLRTAATPSTTP